MFEQFVALRTAAIDTREAPGHTKPFNFNGRTYFCRHEWLPDWGNRDRGKMVWATVLIG